MNQKSYQELIEAFLKNEDYNKETNLCSILRASKSDKHSDWHNYGPIYDLLFDNIKDDNLNVFEVGIMHGYSLTAWQNYFKNSKIYAADINSAYFVENDRVKSFYCNQDNPSTIVNMWNNPQLKDIQFDIIIDDGKHEYESNYNFLVNSIHKLKKGGFYIIEDLIDNAISSFMHSKEDLKARYSLEYIQVICLPSKTNKIDNNLVIIVK